MPPARKPPRAPKSEEDARAYVAKVTGNPAKARAAAIADKYVALDGGPPGNGASSPAEQGCGLLDEVERFLSRFVIYPSEHARVAHVLWVAHAHLMEVWNSTPRIASLSPEPASGKTRALEISELLVPEPVTSVNMSAAYLFRRVGCGENLPTVLYDEIDTVFGEKAREHEEIRGLLNAGHRRGATAGRCVIVNGKVETEEIPAFCAVALAGLDWLPDTILTRAVVVRMRKRKPGEKVEQFRRRLEADQADKLRDRLAAWALQVAPKLQGVYPELPQGVEDRDADKWEPLITVADAAGGEWPARARVAAVTLVTASHNDVPSLGVKLLADIKIAFGDAGAMPTTELLARLNAMPESPWGDMKGKPLDARSLAMRLRNYEIKSKVIRFGEVTKHGYDRADLIDVWERYIPPPPAGGRDDVTSVTDVTGEAGDGTAEADVTGVSDVTHNCAQAGGEIDL